MPSVEKFKESLTQFQVEDNIIKSINSGYEELVSSSPKKQKAAYFKQAIDIMDDNIPLDKSREILEWNACCKGGAREKASIAFRNENKELSLEEKLKKITKVPNMGKPLLNKDGTITIHAVEYWDGDRFACACSNFNKLKRDYPVSKNYCFCCGGHFKYHYEIMLGLTLKVKEVISSPLDSEGKNSCVFLFEVV
ncbi:hypothetical protein [Lachnoclostridium phytofermentans]|uniref:L-2-amino-thiazoline-4-carboxylic acid hydrolase n=1 Tax=Lachnoclostridium phytofermentans (strain ATCC 700394 / DSM 18823 / ISDg) TaxID=357809 RepID=A9KPJ4_LACP7|nr:hypothetical protein [Lachnoclostridium phytofermentans]ABX43268.1 hypothetical protein Cphy_2910 [Lachnoclostridium phytofermentans ISDg]